MIELKITPEEWEQAEREVNAWINPDGTLNVKKMQADVKKELIERHEKSTLWLELATRTGRKGNIPVGISQNIFQSQNSKRSSVKKPKPTTKKEKSLEKKHELKNKRIILL